MRRFQSLLTITWVATVLFVCGGATCARRPAVNPFPPPPSVGLSETPSLEQVAAVVNRNASVRQLSTNTATVEMLSMPSVPRLGATMHLQRQRDFRLRASLPIMLGAGLDMGSNNEVFWFEVPEGIRKTLYYARHDQYQQQLQRAILPVDPSFVMDALGLVQIDPTTVVAGPVQRQDGKLEIRSTSMTPGGMYQRVIYVEPSAGYVTDQLVYDPSGILVAQSEAANHVYYGEQQVVLPHQVKLKLKPSTGPELSMQIEISSYTVNQLLTDDAQLFAMPSGASQVVDLTQLSGMPPTAAATPPGPTAYTADASLAYPMRGLTR